MQAIAPQKMWYTILLSILQSIYNSVN